MERSRHPMDHSLPARIVQPGGSHRADLAPGPYANLATGKASQSRTYLR